jgi:hypothetical protein
MSSQHAGLVDVEQLVEGASQRILRFLKRRGPCG